MRSFQRREPSRLHFDADPNHGSQIPYALEWIGAEKCSQIWLSAVERFLVEPFLAVCSMLSFDSIPQKGDK